MIIRKQSIASAKNGGDDIDDNDYELSTDSYSKDDTENSGYLYTAPSIAGFEILLMVMIRKMLVIR